ncbi:MAG: biopolymer transporter ExbD [Opitutaceae bacterium]
MQAYETDICTSSARRARIEIIPLIDVIFFLLATFVLFTLSLQRMRVVDVTFSVPGRIAPGGESDPVFIQAAADGLCHWQRGSEGVDETITAAELPPRLDQYRRETSNPRVLVRSDGHAKLGDIVRVLDEVRRSGISQVAVETLVARPRS